jgi:lysophospholipase L1-like esterase
VTVNTVDNVAEFVTNGVTTNFPFYFKFLANEDLVVTYIDPLGVSTTLTLGTNYTVNGAGNDQGSVVTTTALAGPGQLTVSREMEAFQQTSLRNQGKFLAETHEDVFDRLTMLIQQGLTSFGRALTRPFGRDYFFAENRRIASVKDPVEPQDAATKKSVETFVAGILATGQGPINNAQNIVYVTVDNKIRGLKSKLDDQIGPVDFAPDLGPTDNYTAAFTALEARYQGLLVDLSGRTFIVDAVPSKNGYQNGFFKVAGFTKSAVIANSFAAQPHHSHLFGGQLATLFQGLSNPLEQMTGIVFLGDSQIWGSGNGAEQATTNPRDGTLSDARDYFGTSSFVNILKRYIGKTFARDAVPVLSNHPTAPTGQSIATYTATNVLFPSDGDFTLVQAAGASISTAVLATPVPITYAQRTMTNSNVAVETGHTLSFNFTGTSFKLGFGCTEATATYYELVVGGVSQGLFSTHAGVDGFIDVTNNNYRTHSFGYVRNALVEIKTRRNGEAGTRILRLESITIDKVIRVTNNGINGASSISYRANNLVGSPADGLAVLPDDNHVIIKIGTNDRISATSRPKGSNAFKANYNLFIDAVKAISPTANIVLCCSNPAAEDPATYSFTMQEVRSVTYQTAKARSIDMVDGYAVFQSLTLVPGFSADGLHLNQAGYELEARNFINSLEASSFSSAVDLTGRVADLEARPRGVGDGQTWQDVTASRVAGTTYTNSTGRPITLSVYNAASASGSFSLTVAGIVIGIFQTNNTTPGASGQLFGVVPPGATYLVAVSGMTIGRWSELR